MSACKHGISTSHRLFRTAMVRYIDCSGTTPKGSELETVTLQGDVTAALRRVVSGVCIY